MLAPRPEETFATFVPLPSTGHRAAIAIEPIFPLPPLCLSPIHPVGDAVFFSHAMVMVMEVNTSRFGSVRVENDDLIHFPAGILGLEECRDWVLLQDGQNDAVAWLQSAERAKIALPVVSPRRFVPDYHIRVAQAELESLELEDVRTAQVLVIAGRSDHAMTLDLKAPLVINMDRRLGRQVVTNGDLPVRYELALSPLAWKKSA
jgi:flagellar assembly factor FliW